MCLGRKVFLWGGAYRLLPKRNEYAVGSVMFARSMSPARSAALADKLPKLTICHRIQQKIRFWGRQQEAQQ